MAVGGFLAGRVDRARDARTHARQRGFGRQRFVAREHALIRAMRRLIPHQRGSLVQLRGIAIHNQLAGARQAEIHGRIRQHRVQCVAAEVGQGQQLGGGCARYRCAASSQKPRQPQPLRGVQAIVQTQRRISPEHPAWHVGEHAGAGQRRHVAVAELPAVGKAAAHGRPRPLVHQRHVVPRPRQQVRRRHADHARPNYAYPHDSPRRFRLGTILGRAMRPGKFQITCHP
ncbi:hypothetical protein D3C72_1221150 [compost metagenome]